MRAAESVRTVLEVTASGCLSEAASGCLGPDADLTVRLRGPVAFDVDTADFASLELYADDPAVRLTVSETAAYDRITVIRIPEGPEAPRTAAAFAAASLAAAVPLAETDVAATDPVITFSVAPKEGTTSAGVVTAAFDYGVGSPATVVLPDGAVNVDEAGSDEGLGPNKVVLWRHNGISMTAADETVPDDCFYYNTGALAGQGGLLTLNCQLESNANSFWQVDLPFVFADDAQDVASFFAVYAQVTPQLFLCTKSGGVQTADRQLDYTVSIVDGTDCATVYWETPSMTVSGLNGGAQDASLKYSGTPAALRKVNDCPAGLRSFRVRLRVSDGGNGTFAGVKALSFAEAVFPVEGEQTLSGIAGGIRTPVVELADGANLTVDTADFDALTVVGPETGLATLTINAPQTLDLSKIAFGAAQNVDVDILSPVTLTVADTAEPQLTLAGKLNIGTAADGSSLLTVVVRDGVTVSNPHKVIVAQGIAGTVASRLPEGSIARLTVLNGICWLTGSGTLRATVSGTASWNTLTWTRNNGTEIAAPDFSDASHVVLTFEPNASLTVDASVTLGSLSLNNTGSWPAAVTLAEGASLNVTASLLVAGGTVSLPQGTLFAVNGTDARPVLEIASGSEVSVAASGTVYQRNTVRGLGGGATLRVSGAAGYDMRGGIRSLENVCLDVDRLTASHGGDPDLRDATIRVRSTCDWACNNWLAAAGTLTVEVDAGANFRLTNNKAFWNAGATGLIKTGQGTFEAQIQNIPVEVREGRLKPVWNGTKAAVTVRAGAVLEETAKAEMSLGQITGEGVIDVVRPSATGTADVSTFGLTAGVFKGTLRIGEGVRRTGGAWRIPCDVELNGTCASAMTVPAGYALGGSGTVTGTLTLEDGALLMVSDDGVCPTADTVSQPVNASASFRGAARADAPVLRSATESLSFTPPEGFSVAYADGVYRLVASELFYTTVRGEASLGAITDEQWVAGSSELEPGENAWYQVQLENGAVLTVDTGWTRPFRKLTVVAPSGDGEAATLRISAPIDFSKLDLSGAGNLTVEFAEGAADALPAVVPCNVRLSRDYTVSGVLPLRKAAFAVTGTLTVSAGTTLAVTMPAGALERVTVGGQTNTSVVSAKAIVLEGTDGSEAVLQVPCAVGVTVAGVSGGIVEIVPGTNGSVFSVFSAESSPIGRLRVASGVTRTGSDFWWLPSAYPVELNGRCLTDIRVPNGGAIGGSGSVIEGKRLTFAAGSALLIPAGPEVWSLQAKLVDMKGSVIALKGTPRTNVELLTTTNHDLRFSLPEEDPDGEKYRFVFDGDTYYLLSKYALTATVSGDSDWASLKWGNTGGETIDSPVFTDTTRMELTLTGGVLTVPEDAPVTVGMLSVMGSGTISGPLKVATSVHIGTGMGGTTAEPASADASVVTLPAEMLFSEDKEAAAGLPALTVGEGSVLKVTGGESVRYRRTAVWGPGTVRYEGRELGLVGVTAGQPILHSVTLRMASEGATLAFLAGAGETEETRYPCLWDATLAFDGNATLDFRSPIRVLAPDPDSAGGVGIDIATGKTVEMAVSFAGGDDFAPIYSDWNGTDVGDPENNPPTITVNSAPDAAGTLKNMITQVPVDLRAGRYIPGGGDTFSNVGTVTVAEGAVFKAIAGRQTVINPVRAEPGAVLDCTEGDFEFVTWLKPPLLSSVPISLSLRLPDTMAGRNPPYVIRGTNLDEIQTSLRFAPVNAEGTSLADTVRIFRVDGWPASVSNDPGLVAISAESTLTADDGETVVYPTDSFWEVLLALARENDTPHLTVSRPYRSPAGLPDAAMFDCAGLFDGAYTVSGNEVCFALDFGISAVTVRGDDIVVTAALELPEGTPPTFAQGTYVNLYTVSADGSEVPVASAQAPASAASACEIVYVGGLAQVQENGSLRFRIKASDAPAVTPTR